MNGNIYIQMSYKKFNISDKACNDIAMILSKDMKPFFSKEFNVKFIDDDNIQKIKIYVMDKPKYDGHDTEIKNHIIKLFESNIKNISTQMIEVSINYSQLNPNFDPTKTAKINNKNDDKKQENGAASKLQNSKNEKKQKTDEFDYAKLSLNYSAEDPRYSFEQVILPKNTLEQIERAIGILKVESKVFDEWGLRSIIPTANSALSFYGPPGTGKSMAAEAIAQKLGKKILSATYADIESKFHGEGPKMVKAIFMAAERDDAVLFLDESDSLLSKRLTNVSDGSAQAINSMRSQLLISLERFKGIVIFATNLVVNYDRAFLSRLINIEFTMPTSVEREKIWWQHVKSDTVHVPLSSDVDIKALAEAYEFCGREIKSSVKSACIATALENRDEVTQSDFIKACELTKEETKKVLSTTDHTASKTAPINNEQKKALIDVVQKKIDSSK